MKCIDFDGQFAKHIHDWLAQHEEEYADLDQAEAKMPQVYAAFLDTPAAWLDGQKPGAYFDAYGDAAQLVDWMGEYLAQGVHVPDMLLNRIASLGKKAEAPLLAILADAQASTEKKMLAVTLLGEIGSRKPVPTYIAWQIDRALQDELADHALEQLEAMGQAARKDMLAAIPQANDAGREALLSVLSHFGPDDLAYTELLRLFARYPQRQAILAAYLGRLGDERALPALMERALDEGTGYLDFIELRCAIEELGGEAPARDFDEDAEYGAPFSLSE